MQVAHIFSGNPNSGAASGAINLCRGLFKKQIDIKIFNDVCDFTLKDKEIYFEENIKKKIFSYKNKILDRYIFFDFKSKVKFSSGLTGSMPIKYDNINKFDIVHLHWINNGFFSLNNLENIKVPIVWTIRDMWPLTGGCHYSLGCKKFYKKCETCPQLNSYFPKIDQVNKIFNIKKKLLENLDINIVPISKWLENETKKSLILKKKNITQIYNCVDDKIFFPEEIKDARTELNLPFNKFVVLIGSQKLDDNIKNNMLIDKISKEISDENIIFISFGDRNKSFKNIKNFGFIKDKNILRKIYSSSNVFLSFSKEEAFGKTLVESLMCNTPIIVNDNHSSKEIVSHKKNGYLVENGNYIEAIYWIKKNMNKYLSKFDISDNQQFNIDTISNEYIKLYHKILKKNL